MTVYELAKIFSSENKSKIIAHYWNCKCREHDCVGDIEKELDINQSNLSKHIGKLLKLGVLTYKQVHKERFYQIDPKFKHEWAHIVEPIVNSREVAQYTCKECQHGTK